MTEGQDHPGVLIFPPMLFAISFVVGLIAHFFSYDHWALAWPFRLLGLGIVVGGISIAIWGQNVMRAAGTNVRPDMPAIVIVSDGPFAFTRNPLYLSVIFIFIGAGLLLASPVFLAVIVPMALVVNFGVVVREERYLEAKFGDAYRAYKARVRRWI